jgi:hypothetical protein
MSEEQVPAGMYSQPHNMDTPDDIPARLSTDGLRDRALIAQCLKENQLLREQISKLNRKMLSLSNQLHTIKNELKRKVDKRD